eukprot:6308338-Prymnesium_polylepis.1
MGWGRGLAAGGRLGLGSGLGAGKGGWSFVCVWSGCAGVCGEWMCGCVCGVCVGVWNGIELHRARACGEEEGDGGRVVLGHGVVEGGRAVGVAREEHLVCDVRKGWAM